MSLLIFILLDGMQTLPGVSGVGLAIERSQLSLKTECFYNYYCKIIMIFR